MHPRSNWQMAIALALGIIFLPPSADALVKKPSNKTTAAAKSAKKPTASAKKTTQRDRRKKTPYILAPKTGDIVMPEKVHAHRFGPELSDDLVRGDLTQAYHDLQLAEASDKAGYLINQVLMAQGKATYFDRATAYHNLYLFLARQGRPGPKLLKEAAKYYRKAARKAGYTDKATVLLAALWATAGDAVQSESYFNKVDVTALTRGGDDYNGLEYLATYYAAGRNTAKALTYLDSAYKLNPGSLLLWLHVGDDFWAIEDDELFKTQLAQWTDLHKKRLAQLQHDKSTHDVRKKTALTPKKSKKSVKKSGKKTR